ncbi:MAG: pyridoxal-phosphate dependent enzyme [Deltaproteobacteria bacterium]|nr:pyridoxal-phosphate dependent enzyme [Deltaproteobacteria bacterium]
MPLGNWPTPVERLDALSPELWVKRDDLSHPMYGGNKVRKLEHLLPAAQARGAKRILTIGALGSHHVLATVLHARDIGLPVAAVLVPQPVTPGVIANLRAGLAAGLEPYVASSGAMVPAAIARAFRRGDFLIPPGGSTVIGSLGYVDAVAEIAASVRSGTMPEPDVILAALGSGGTVAGLLAGVIQHGLRSRVIGVHVVTPPATSTANTLFLARMVCRRLGIHASSADLWKRLETDSSMLGKGYGHATSWGDRATERAATVGLTLDPTYTAKAFAHALALVNLGAAGTVLYVHTLSSAPMGPLLEGAPDETSWPEELRELVARRS